MKEQIQPANGKLGILLPGLGAVATTVIAGVVAVNKGLAEPIGALTQMGNIRLGKRTENRYPLIKDFVPLAPLQDVVFGGWDVYSDNVYEAAMNAKVLESSLLNAIKPELEAIKPMKAVFDKSYVKNLDGTHIKQAATKWDLANEVINDIENFKTAHGCDRVVIVWCGSTERYIEQSAVHETIESFEAGLKTMILLFLQV